jgi:hypothetical protein
MVMEENEQARGPKSYILAGHRRKRISPWTKALYTCWSWKKTNKRVDQRVIYLLVIEENE